MSLLPIYVLGAPVLRVETELVTEFTDELQTLIDDMFETMYAAQGIGLAAPQIGRTERLAVVDVDHNPLVIINPEIVESHGEIVMEEGCLSVINFTAEIGRARKILLRGWTPDQKPIELEAEELGVVV